MSSNEKKFFDLSSDTKSHTTTLHDKFTLCFISNTSIKVKRVVFFTNSIHKNSGENPNCDEENYILIRVYITMFILYLKVAKTFQKKYISIV